MAKALVLDPDVLMNAQPVPSAAQMAGTKPKGNKLAVGQARVPLQVRWPAEDVKAAKLAAIQLDFPSVSDFILACLHEFMKTAR